MVQHAEAEILEPDVPAGGVVAREERLGWDGLAERGERIAVEERFLAREVIRQVDVEGTVARLPPVDDRRLTTLHVHMVAMEVRVEQGEGITLLPEGRHVAQEARGGLFEWPVVGG